jgi:hypothetical protein
LKKPNYSVRAGLQLDDPWGIDACKQNRHCIVAELGDFEVIEEVTLEKTLSRNRAGAHRRSKPESWV